MRRTKVVLIYEKTGNLRACQLLLGHRKLESTVRYLGIEVDDAPALSEQVDLEAGVRGVNRCPASYTWAGRGAPECRKSSPRLTETSR